MKRSDSLRVVAMLNAGFPRDALEGPSLELWADELALLHDPTVAGEAARLTVRNGTSFPTLKEFRATYRSVADASRVERPALPEPPGSRVIPEWVLVWAWARFRRSPRLWKMLPQQDEYDCAPDVLTPDEYEALKAEWVAAGSPRVKDPFGVVGGAQPVRASTADKPGSMREEAA